MLSTRAPAKINLTLHVLGRRPDGYHELDSIVAFAGAADTLTLEPGPALSLAVEGPTAVLAGPVADNLVLRAAGRLAERVSGLAVGSFRLVKRLPAAAGIGGGSSDAAGALRLMARLNGLAPDHPSILDAARATGADVPVCLDPRARTMRGVGDRVGPPLRLPPLFAVLVNPRVAVPTPAVFQALGLSPGDRAGEAPPDDAVDVGHAIARGRNDLEPAAIGLAPAIGEALAALRSTPGCDLARMSGSGATVFGLFPDCRSAAAGARTLRAAYPGWWIRPTLLR